MVKGMVAKSTAGMILFGITNKWCMKTISSWPVATVPWYAVLAIEVTGESGLLKTREKILVTCDSKS